MFLISLHHNLLLCSQHEIALHIDKYYRLKIFLHSLLISTFFIVLRFWSFYVFFVESPYFVNIFYHFNKSINQSNITFHAGTFKPIHFLTKANVVNLPAFKYVIYNVNPQWRWIVITNFIVIYFQPNYYLTK